jgi:hypothetical protein
MPKHLNFLSCSASANVEVMVEVAETSTPSLHRTHHHQEAFV